MARTLATLMGMLETELRDPDGIKFVDADKIYALNQAYRYVYQVVLDANQGYFQTSINHNIVAGTATIALPSDHHRTVRLEYVDTNTTTPIFERRRGATVNYTNVGSYAIDRGIYTYYLRGANIVLEPTPQSSVTNGVLHEYIKVLAESDELAISTDTLDAEFKDVWVDVIVLEAAVALTSQTQVLGANVNTNLLSRLEKATNQMLRSLVLRTLSPNRNRRTKGYFK